MDKTGWTAFDQLPERLSSSRKMFVVIGIGVDVSGSASSFPYTTDPWCVWVDDAEKWKDEKLEDHYRAALLARWPFSFLPTHFLELPPTK